MVRLECSRDHIGAVYHPESGDLVQLDEDHQRELAELVADAHDHITVVDDGDASGVTHESSSEYPTNDNGEPLCVGKDSGQCGRTVDEPGGECWQHQDNE
jgi:hypothetical protein